MIGECVRKKGTKKNLFYIISNVHVWFFFSLASLSVCNRVRECEKEYAWILLLKLLSSSFRIYLSFSSHGRQECAKYQSVSMLFKRFTLLPPSLFRIATYRVCEFSAVLLLLMILLLRTHFSTQLVLSHRIRFPFNRNRFVINSVLTIDVRVCTAHIYFIKCKRNACSLAIQHDANVCERLCQHLLVFFFSAKCDNHRMPCHLLEY